MISFPQRNFASSQIRQFFLAARCVFAAISALSVATSRANEPSELNGDVIIQWNQLLTETARVPGLHPATIRVERSYSMLHVAMFDAVNAIERRYTSFLFDGQASSGASEVAACAQAAHDILTALYPSRQPIYDAALAATLAAIPAGRAQQGANIGATVAAQVLVWRSSDRWDAVPPAYAPPELPGYWQPTPPSFGTAVFTHFPDVVPFAIESGTQFVAPPPPFLNSADYAEAFNEAKRLGAKNSTDRTADQTLVANLHASVGTRATPISVWNGIARDVSRSQALGLVDTARLFALLNVAFLDAVQTSFAGKYGYHLWRPVTAIRRAGEDLNPATDPDSEWQPLLSSPRYPTYPGNAAALSAASARILARFFGTDAIAFDVFFESTDPAINPNGWTRSYSSFWQCADEQARSRVYGGIHFTFDSVASQQSAVELADWVFECTLVPR